MASSRVCRWLFCRKVGEIEYGKPTVRTASRRDGPLRALFVDHDADDFDIVGRIEFFQYIFRVGHLRHRIRGNETDRVNVS